MPRTLFGCMVALAWILQSATSIQINTARAQDATPQIAVEDDPIAVGRQLEIQQRWQEAIVHYEKFNRKHPEQVDIARRLQIVRIRYDVWRRYTDQTFISTVDNSSPKQALDLYEEILTKLDLYYVDQLKFTDLLRNGTAFLETALTDKDFLQQNVSRVSAEQVEQFRLNVHRLVLGKPANSIREAQAIVSNVAIQARDQIGAAPSAVIYEYIAGAVGMLDPYSSYLTAGEYDEMMSQIKGNLIGIGVELWAEQNDLEVEEVFPNGPAHQAGLQHGDRIVAIDNRLVSEMGAKRAADLLRGQEHSKVAVSIERINGTSMTLWITRRQVEVPSVSEIRMVDREAGIGYIRISNFQYTTPKEVDTALIDLTNQGMRSLIVDVRRNPGGLLEAAVELADRFIERGNIVSTRGRNGAENHNYAAHYANTTKIPLMVMIDEDSASASEIFAGAIRDNERGLIVGRTSYGKGTVQGVFHNDSGAGGIRLTVSKFYAPTGYAISSRGIIPHIEFESGKSPKETLVAKPIVLPEDPAERSAMRRTQRIERQQAEDIDLQRAVVEAQRQLARYASVGR